MANAVKKKKENVSKIQVVEKDGATKVIGSYYSDKQLFVCKRKRSEHYMNKFKAWGLDSRVVEFLVKQGARIVLTDTESKWEYECEAVDFVVHGVKQEFNQHLEQTFLEDKYWTVNVAKNRSHVISCEEKDCKFNFSNNCSRGAIRINKDGLCDNYMDRM